jgi:hypothetical protein
VYGWLLRGKAVRDFFELVGCGHVFGVVVQTDVLRAMMNVRWSTGPTQSNALESASD